jgi:hypothetical protein
MLSCRINSVRLSKHILHPFSLLAPSGFSLQGWLAEETMKKALFLILLLPCTPAWAQKAPNPADYTTVVHVQSSHLFADCRDSWGMSNPGGLGKASHCGIKQQLNVVINGKKYELNSREDSDFVLRTGDYKAKGWENVPAELSEYHMEVELLLPEGRTHTYRVVGESE